MGRDNPRGMRAFDRWALRLAAALALICAASVAAQQPVRAEGADATKMLVADAIAFEHGEGVPRTC
jgi:hypothetical protein